MKEVLTMPGAPQLRKVEITFEHRLEFKAAGRAKLSWTVAEIEKLRKAQSVPDEAGLYKSSSRLTFSWSGPFEAYQQEGDTD